MRKKFHTKQYDAIVVIDSLNTTKVIRYGNYMKEALEDTSAEPIWTQKAVDENLNKFLTGDYGTVPAEIKEINKKHDEEEKGNIFGVYPHQRFKAFEMIIFYDDVDDVIWILDSEDFSQVKAGWNKSLAEYESTYGKLRQTKPVNLGFYTTSPRYDIEQEKISAGEIPEEVKNNPRYLSPKTKELEARRRVSAPLVKNAIINELGQDVTNYFIEAVNDIKNNARNKFKLNSVLNKLKVDYGYDLTKGGAKNANDYLDNLAKYLKRDFDFEFGSMPEYVYDIPKDVAYGEPGHILNREQKEYLRNKYEPETVTKKMAETVEVSEEDKQKYAILKSILRKDDKLRTQLKQLANNMGIDISRDSDIQSIGNKILRVSKGTEAYITADEMMSNLLSESKRADVENQLAALQNKYEELKRQNEISKEVAESYSEQIHYGPGTSHTEWAATVRPSEIEVSKSAIEKQGSAKREIKKESLPQNAVALIQKAAEDEAIRRWTNKFETRQTPVEPDELNQIYAGIDALKLIGSTNKDGLKNTFKRNNLTTEDLDALKESLDSVPTIIDDIYERITEYTQIRHKNLGEATTDVLKEMKMYPHFFADAKPDWLDDECIDDIIYDKAWPVPIKEVAKELVKMGIKDMDSAIGFVREYLENNPSEKAHVEDIRIEDK